MNNDDTDLTDLGFEPNNQPEQHYREPVVSENVVNPVRQTNNHTGYRVVKRDSGEHKNGSGEIVVETSIKGLIYNCEVLKDGIMIDGEEVNCSDLQSKENRDSLFRDKYSAAHNRLKKEYIGQENFDEVLRKEGKYKENNDKHCKVITFKSADIIKTVIEVGGTKFDEIQVVLSDGMKKDKELVDAKSKVLHSDMIKKYIAKDGFPVNIKWLDNILRKFSYFYEKKPMYAFYFLLGLIFLFFFILKLFMCSDFMINKKKEGKRFEYFSTYAPYCTKFQEKIINGCEDSNNLDHWKGKSKIFKAKNCQKCRDFDFVEREMCTQWINSITKFESEQNGTGHIPIPSLNTFQILPLGAIELSQKKISNIYVKNNDPQKTIVFTIIGRSLIDGEESDKYSEIIMLVNEDKNSVEVEPFKDEKFELKLDYTYIKNFSRGEKHNGIVVLKIQSLDHSIDTQRTVKINFMID